MLGKEKCRILKQIRQTIADANDIPYVTRECGFHGECRGTCPRCESELRYLEKQLEARSALGKKVSVAALCAGMALSTVGCAPIGGTSQPGPMNELAGAVAYVEPSPEPTDVIEIETGEIAWPEETNDDEPETGEIACPEPELTGDAAYTPEESPNG